MVDQKVEILNRVLTRIILWWTAEYPEGRYYSDRVLFSLVLNDGKIHLLNGFEPLGDENGHRLNGTG